MNDTERPTPSGTKSDGVKRTADYLLSQAKAAVVTSNALGAAYGRWYASGSVQVRKQGQLAFWREGLFVTMRVAAASLEAQSRLEEALIECKAQLVDQRRTLSAMSQDCPERAELERLLGESIESVQTLHRGLSVESTRFGGAMQTWDDLAVNIAEFYSLPPSVLWQVEEYMGPEMFMLEGDELDADDEEGDEGGDEGGGGYLN